MNYEKTNEKKCGNMNNIRNIIKNILPYIFVFIASLHRVHDPDLGWHLKYGEYFFTNFRILRENTFSTLMSDFYWINISWGVDVLNYAFYSAGGFLALSIAGALSTVLAFYFFSQAFKLDYWAKALVFPVLIYFLYPIIETSFRGQTLSLAFLGAMILILSIYQDRKGKILYLLPVLFFVWANIHGLFVLGLGIIFIWQGFYLISNYLLEKDLLQSKNILLHFFIINIITILASAIHPYGFYIYFDAFLRFRDPLLKGIQEYLSPAELTGQWYSLIIAGFFASIGSFAYVVNKKVIRNLPMLGVFVVLFVLSIWVKRYSWAMYYLIIPLITPAANLFKPDGKKSVFWASTVLFIFFILTTVFLKAPFDKYKDMNWDVYCHQYLGCSPKAVEELKNYYIEGETMTLYDWGGWLIWEYPEIKPSSDGRMHLWRDESGFSAFEYDYYFEQNLNDINTSHYNVVFTNRFKNIYDRLIELTREGKWELVYEDATTVIFLRNT